MARKCIIAGNWKMNLDPDQGFELIEGIKAGFKPKANLEVVVIPPMPLVALAAHWVTDSTLSLGAQTSSSFRDGAHTGDTSPELLRILGCRYALSGHSERRGDHHESDAQVAAQAKAQVEAGLKTIVCCGESLQEREAGVHINKIKNQIGIIYDTLPPEYWGEVSIAYEPIWAIGTGKTASPVQAQEIHKMIRDHIESKAGAQVARSTAILYGGSVKPDNAASLFSQADVDGGLIGGASLVAADFLAIASAAAA